MQVYSSLVHGTSAESVMVECLLHTHSFHAIVTFGHVRLQMAAGSDR